MTRRPPPRGGSTPLPKVRLAVVGRPGCTSERHQACGPFHRGIDKTTADPRDVDASAPGPGGEHRRLRLPATDDHRGTRRRRPPGPAPIPTNVGPISRSRRAIAPCSRLPAGPQNSSLTETDGTHVTRIRSERPGTRQDRASAPDGSGSARVREPRLERDWPGSGAAGQSPPERAGPPRPLEPSSLPALTRRGA